MAVAFDAVGPSAAGASALAATSLTWSHTVGGSANAIIAGCALGQSPDTPTLTATYNAVSMTAGAVVHSGGGTTGYLRVFTLAAPSTGANNLVCTASTTVTSLVGGSMSALSVASFKAQYSATGTSASATATSAGSVSGSLLAAFCCTGNSVTSATAPSTSRWIKNAAGSSAAGNAGGATSPGTGSNVTTAWAISSDVWAVIGVELLEAVAAVGPPILVMPPYEP